MGKRGRAKRPTNLTVLMGNPGRRPVNKDEPKPRVFDGAAPEHLTEAERKIWEQYAPGLIEGGLLTVADVSEFCRYCEMQARYQEAMDFLKKNGMVYVKNKESKLVGKWPQVGIAKEYGGLARQIAAKFGMTPSDRTGLKGVKPEGKSAFEEFLSRKK